MDHRQAPFLKQAGEGTLDPAVLSEWLAQDRLYAQNYINFAGALLSKIRLPVAVDSQSTEKKAARLVSFAVQNVIRELQFFEDTAARYNINLIPRWEGDGLAEVGPNQTTRAYADLMLSATSPSASLLEGLTLLYATEVCYLTAWGHAKSFVSSSSNQASNKVEEALQKEFIPNWTCEEFVEFVKDCKTVMDEAASKTSEEDRQRALQVYRQVLWFEEKFWPAV